VTINDPDTKEGLGVVEYQRGSCKVTVAGKLTAGSSEQEEPEEPGDVDPEA
jgi:hypothetical protein